MQSNLTNILRILLYIFTFIFTYFFLKWNIKTYGFKGLEILNILISVSSIIVAIVVTFLFTKLFAENSIRIERKKEIDELSLKITYLRSIAHHILKSHEFWKFDNINVKGIIDTRYKELTYEDYYKTEKTPSEYEEWIKIDEDIKSTIGVAYLALKGLEDGEDSFKFYSEINPKNYNLDDIERYKEYANAFWYLLDRIDDKRINFDGVNSFWMNDIEKLYFKITNKQIDKKNYRSQLKDLFSEFVSVTFVKHFFKTSQNTVFPATFKTIFFNLSIFVLIVISCLLLYILDINGHTGRTFVLLSVSLFTANAVDLILITFISIKKELNIQEIYRI